MPHIVLEHTERTADRMGDLCQVVFDAGCATSVFTDPKTVKVRSCLCANHTGGTGDDFVHATIRMLEGRTDDQKSEVSVAVLNALSAALPDVANLTVEVMDMHTASYQKRSL